MIRRAPLRALLLLSLLTASCERGAPPIVPLAPVEPLTARPAAAQPGPAEIAIAKVVERVHFAYRPDADELTGGHSTYAARVAADGTVAFQPVRRPQAGPAPVAPPTLAAPAILTT